MDNIFQFPMLYTLNNYIKYKHLCRGCQLFINDLLLSTKYSYALKNDGNDDDLMNVVIGLFFPIWLLTLEFFQAFLKLLSLTSYSIFPARWQL